MRTLSLVMGALFLVGALLQLNDPDPAPWMAMYVAAAALSFLAYRRVPHPAPPLILAFVALVWAADIGFGVLRSVPFMEMFATWQMRDSAVEESREIYGLAIIAAWMVALAVHGWRGRAAASRFTPAEPSHRTLDQR